MTITIQSNLILLVQKVSKSTELYFLVIYVVSNYNTQKTLLICFIKHLYVPHITSYNSNDGYYKLQRTSP